MDGNKFEKQFMAIMIEQRRMDDLIEDKLVELERKTRLVV